MKIVYVIGGLYRGGIENWLLNISTCLMRDGYEVAVINVTGKGDLLPLFQDAGIPVYNVGKAGQPAGTHRLDTALKLRKLFKELKPDVVQSMHFSANHHARLAALGLKFPVITNLRNVTRETKILRRVMNKLLSVRTTLFVSVAKAVAEVVRLDHNLFGKPSRVIYNGIPEKHFTTEPANIDDINLPEAAPVLVAACRLTRVKNIDFFLNAFRTVVDSIPDAQFLLMGDGGDRLKLEQLTDSLGLRANVHFMGMRSDVPAVLKALSSRRSIFVMPSLWEGFPNAALEALACGVPLVVADTVPIKEVTEDAALVLPLEQQVWAESLIDLLQDKERLETMKRAGLDVANRYRYSAHVAAWKAVYEELAAK